jgi:hypothetical protein
MKKITQRGHSLFVLFQLVLTGGLNKATCDRWDIKYAWKKRNLDWKILK